MGIQTAGIYVSEKQYNSDLTTNINSVDIYKYDGESWFKNGQLIGQSWMPVDLIPLLPQ